MTIAAHPSGVAYIGRVGAAEPDRVGLCVVRAWRYGDRVLFRVRLRADVDEVASERAVVTADRAEALRAVQQFLDLAAAERIGGMDGPAPPPGRSR